MARRRRRRAWQQQELRARTWGGPRDGAGRPRKPGAGVSHERRRCITRHEVAHVTVRLLPVVASLRNGRAFRVVTSCIAAGRDRFGFRLVEFSLQGHHLHLIVEAEDRRALARGMQGLNVRLARRLNRHLGRTGPLLADRYHCRIVRTPAEVRILLGYVLCNSRKHAAERGERLERGWIDPFSSGPHFRGWCDLVRPASSYARGPRATAPPGTWLLRVGWRRRGLLSVDTVPGSR